MDKRKQTDPANRLSKERKDERKKTWPGEEMERKMLVGKTESSRIKQQVGGQQQIEARRKGEKEVEETRTGGETERNMEEEKK